MAKKLRSGWMRGVVAGLASAAVFIVINTVYSYFRQFPSMEGTAEEMIITITSTTIGLLVLGLIIGLVYLLLYDNLPRSTLKKGLLYGLIVFAFSIPSFVDTFVFYLLYSIPQFVFILSQRMEQIMLSFVASILGCIVLAYAFEKSKKILK